MSNRICTQIHVGYRKFVYIIISTIVVFACSSVTVFSDYDKDYSFKGLRIFQWIDDSSNASKSIKPSTNRFIRKNIEESLIEKGFSKADDNKPDFYVIYHLGVEEQLNVKDFGYQYGQWQSGIFDREVYGQPYREGRLIIDMIEKNDKELIWRGWASVTVDEPSRAEKRIRQAIREILKNFPLGESK